jgi:hypothetical protein
MGIKIGTLEIASKPEAPVAGVVHTAKMLEAILAELQKLNANLAKPKPKVETR